MKLAEKSLLTEIYSVIGELNRIPPSNPCDIARLAEFSRTGKDVLRDLQDAILDLRDGEIESAKMNIVDARESLARKGKSL